MMPWLWLIPLLLVGWCTVAFLLGLAIAKAISLNRLNDQRWHERWRR